MSRNIYVLANIVCKKLLVKKNTLNGKQIRLITTTIDGNEKIEKTATEVDLISGETKREVEHHAKLSGEWWNLNGPMYSLHSLNEIRVPFIRDGLIARGNVEKHRINTVRVLEEQRILEVGCGGGILTEQLARLGANVTGIDLGEELINTARCHLAQASAELKQNIEYMIVPIEEHAKEKCDYYDAVVISEVLEHIDDKVSLLQASVRTLKPGGSLFITTINKTLAMWFGGILVGEYVLGLAPKGTHHWEKMITPLDVQRILDTMNCQTVLINGSTYDFWRNTWRWTNTTNMCYALQAVKLPVAA